MTIYSERLIQHDSALARLSQSESRLLKIRADLRGRAVFESGNYSVYAVGSLARREAGSRSDFDVFVIADGHSSNVSQLDRYEVFAALIDANRALGYPRFSKDGRFLSVYGVDTLLTSTGSPSDDSENCFTARLLLLLESAPLMNDALFHSAVKRICENYFRDHKGRKDFKPLYLLNDLLRYWRTLCLNYEQHRSDGSRPWWKKNVNLKFARRMTVFSMVAALVAELAHSPAQLIDLVGLRPLERFALVLDRLQPTEINPDRFSAFLADYEMFLTEKEQGSNSVAEHRVLAAAEVRFKLFIAELLSSQAIKQELRHFLIS
jgi:predicted nucleotidyltransferase